MRSGRGQRSVAAMHPACTAPGACTAEPMACAPGDEPAGCGWFESSRSLREGADVREHEVLDPIVNDLPLAWWVEWAGLRAHTRRP
jgi:hypothetical protein